MTYVVTDACIRCKYMDCVEVCPVDCFYEGENMLVINPDECIDCGVCEPECPVDAIKPGLGVGLDRIDGTFGLAHPAIDTLVGIDDEHVLAFIEAVHRTDLDAIHVLAADASIGDDVGHGVFCASRYVRVAALK